MTTLNAIAITTVGSSLVAIFAFIFFAFAVRTGSHKVAPRCSARSPDTIFNPKARKKRSWCNIILCFWRRGEKSSKLKKSDDNNASSGRDSEDDEDARNPEYVQYRGGPMFGWIPWTMSLSYEQLLKGVPGTGTRKNGMDGSMLKVNLDGIVLLRFHAICLRMAILGTFLGGCIILPINLTANCFQDDGGFTSCYDTPNNLNLTNYEVTTIENIPILDISDELLNEFNWWHSIFGASFKIFGSNYGSFLGRLYAIVLVSWIMIFYCLHLLKKEWVDALALRRIYYLEGRHWENRIEELNDTVLKEDLEESDDEKEDLKPGALRKRRLINKGGKGPQLVKKKKKKKKKSIINDRPPWIPHPEQRDTVPNIELYSVLVGQIPAVPSEIANDEKNNGDDDAANEMKQSLDWQLRVTSTFFDQCVPNQPGFSSSVAAVTMLPDAPKLALAWKTWYKHCALLRRLRFVRELIAEKRHYDIDECIENYEEDAYDIDQQPASGPDYPNGNDNGIVENEQAPAVPVGSQDYLDDDYPGAELSDRMKDEYDAIQQRINYYSNVFGAEFNDIVLDMEEGSKRDGEDPEEKYAKHATLGILTQILSYGPEQTAVYSKEFARGASTCCPNGCREEKLSQASLRDLEDLEATLKAVVIESFEKLKVVQKTNVLRDESDDHHKGIHTEKGDKSTDDDDVELQLYSRTPSKYSNAVSTSYDGNIFGDETHNQVENYRYEAQPTVDEENPSVSFEQKDHSRQSLPPLAPRESPSQAPHNSIRSSQMTLTNQGKVYFKDVTAVGSHASEGDEVSHGASWSVQTPRRMLQDGDNASGSDQHLTSSRRRLDTGGFSQMTLPLVEENKVSDWEKVQQAVNDNNAASGNNYETTISSGAWKIPSCGAIMLKLWRKIRFPFESTIDAVDEIKSTTTFAVVTFTSRQAAVAARHCLSDGRGVGRWIPVEDIPVPPLADAAVCDFCDCRGCCRPVTLTIHPKQQLIRRYMTIIMLAVLFVFYTLPLTFASALVAPEKLDNLIPGIEKAAQENPMLSNLLSGIMPALFYSLFFALCPIMFKSLSNFGSNAVSVNQAEFIALQYYWWFMLVTAFSGISLTTMALNLINERGNSEATLTTLLLSIAATLPRQISATWLNWIIFRTFCTLPLMYMLNIHTFIFQCLGWKCCIRCVMGGGPGGPIPYRIYIDSGVVFMCVMGLVPVSPLLAPAALGYYLFCAPLWRRNLIYMYRPNFDTGGIRWPFLSDVFLSAICVSQILLTTTMALKKALGPAILSSVVLIPVYLHRRSTRKRYLRSYMDAALLQTSQLDGWDNTAPTSKEIREEYRKFLVDAHRAAYVPICLAGEQASGLTSEPAVVVPHPNDILEPIPLQNPSGNFEYEGDSSVITPSVNELHSRWRNQPGASWRRVQHRNSFNDEASIEQPNNRWYSNQ